MTFKGLTKKEVLKARNEFGENILPSKNESSLFEVFLRQFESPLLRVTVAVGLISLIFGNYIDAMLIQGVALLNALTGFFQEYSVQNTLTALRNLLKPRANVIRDNTREVIDIKDVVVGDLCLLEPGEKIPADGKLIEADKMLVNEAILTGEEQAVEKDLNKNKLFMGTTVLSGRGKMIVEKVGKETEIGKIGASLYQIEDEETVTQKKLKKLSLDLTHAVAFLTFLLFAIGLLKNMPLYEMARLSIILAVATIPEGLPIVITVIMTIGMRRILKTKGLVKRLNSLEVLGSVSVICIDKTGTITEGKMEVVKTDLINKKMAIIGSILNNDRTRSLEWALWNYAQKMDFDPEKIFNQSPRLYEKPFDSEHKYSITVNQIKGKKIAFAMGAPEVILNLCKMTDKKIIMDKINAWAVQGLRVAGIAYKDKGNLKEEKNYLWLGLFAIEDPLREGAKETIENAQKAGINIKIVTGDYRQTAEKIAKNLGFHIDKNSVMEGEELEKISDAELKKRIMDIVLFSRTTPHQKLKIVRVLQELGERVAMTGDGVNDAPALKKADIGVAVGNATEVAKEAGDIILLDPGLQTIIAACKEGRIIFLNIKRAVSYILANSFTKMMVVFGAIIFNLPAPLTIVQILLVHIVCDGPPDIVLAFEPSNGNIMKQKPLVYAGTEILPKSKKILILLISIFVSLTCLSIFWYYDRVLHNLVLAQTMVFAILSSVSLIYIFAFKDLEILIIKNKHFWDNKILPLGVLYGFIIILGSIYLPLSNQYLGTTPLSFRQWLIVLLVGLGATLIAEMSKVIKSSSLPSI